MASSAHRSAAKALLLRVKKTVYATGIERRVTSHGKWEPVQRFPSVANRLPVEPSHDDQISPDKRAMVEGSKRLL
jgi:hypothetical protein